MVYCSFVEANEMKLVKVEWPLFSKWKDKLEIWQTKLLMQSVNSRWAKDHFRKALWELETRYKSKYPKAQSWVPFWKRPRRNVAQELIDQKLVGRREMLLRKKYPKHLGKIQPRGNRRRVFPHGRDVGRRIRFREGRKEVGEFARVLYCKVEGEFEWNYHATKGWRRNRRPV